MKNTLIYLKIQLIENVSILNLIFNQSVHDSKNMRWIKLTLEMLLEFLFAILW